MGGGVGSGCIKRVGGRGFRKGGEGLWGIVGRRGCGGVGEVFCLGRR